MTDDVKWCNASAKMMIEAVNAASEAYIRDIQKIAPIVTEALRRSFEPDPNITITTCPHCNGKGKVIRKHHKSKKKARKKCPVCNGCGKEIRYNVPGNVKYARRIEYGKTDH